VLTELTVENLAIVERARLEPAAGLTALSGETGAGKSLLVGALTLLTGGRAELDAIRAGEPRARLEARFELAPGAVRDRALELLDAWGISCDAGEIVIRREIAREGKSRAWINQASVTVGALAELGAILLEVHGQHEHQQLLQPERQRDVLDRWADLAAARATCARTHAAWRLATDARVRFAEESARAAAEPTRGPCPRGTRPRRTARRRG
jgi:DNA repair protein RecN (Recombination protein N)